MQTAFSKYFIGLLALVFLALGCSNDATGTKNGDDASDGVNADNDGKHGDNNGSDGTIDDLYNSNNGKNNGANNDDPSDAVCAANDFTVTPVPVAMMILQDMSGSMDPKFNDATGRWDDDDNPGRWSIAKPAIISLLTDYADYSTGNIEFGFDIFPRGSGCELGSSPLMDTIPGESQSMAIVDLLEREYDANSPEGATPLRGAMDLYLNTDYAPNFLSSDRQSYLLIISDGADTCRGNRYVSSGGATAEQLGEKSAELLEAGVKTFVIGFGGGVDFDQLNAIAKAGGTPFTEFLYADDQANLEEAFSEIAASIVQCDFEVPTQDGDDVDSDNVNFYLNGEAVPYDKDCAQGLGWTWTRDDLTEVRMCEAICDQLQKGGAELTATWGCPTIIIDLQ